MSHTTDHDRPVAVMTAAQEGMLWGSQVSDALAMPAHWYYQRDAITRDYGVMGDYRTPTNPHPDSILWRSHYEPLNDRGEILHEQAVFWGKRGIHYHQFLEAGENTLNAQLALMLAEQIKKQGGYIPSTFLEAYRDFMLTPGSHRDTYLEECHRRFFEAHARGRALERCGAVDGHIGGLFSVAPLVALHKGSWPELRKIVRQQVAWTHRHEGVLKSAEVMARVLWAVHEGEPLREAVERHGNDFFSARKASPWLHQEDAVVMDRHFSAACYIEHAFPVTLYLAWKYADDFEAGLMANTHLGGDNCHRGMVMGAMIGAAVGKEGIPGPWIQELKAHQALAALTERTTGDAPMDHDGGSF